MVPGRSAFGTGVYWMKFFVTDDIRFPGMVLFRNGAPVRGSTIALPFEDFSPSRFPASYAGVDDNAVSMLLLRLCNDSQLPKKNSLFLTISPPAVIPYWFCRNGAFGWDV